MNVASVILAAGQGTRMKSTLQKNLHPILGKPMAWYGLQASKQVASSTPVLVVGFGAEQVRSAFGEEVRYAQQEQQLGTGHAVMQAEPLLRGEAELVLVTYADMPLLKAETLKRMVESQQAHNGAFTMLTVVLDDPHGFGRVVRGTDGSVLEIVEEAQATPKQLEIQELNVGVYCFKAEWLWQALPRIPISRKGEYYLTDLAAIAQADGIAVQALAMEDWTEMIGINTRVHLAEATALMRERINREWMLEGVTMIDPQAVYIEPEVTIGKDTVLWPGTYLHGKTQIGEACVIGPNAIIQDTKIGDRCTVLASVMEGAELEDDVEVGPFGHLRKGAHLAEHVHMGNFGEVKNSYLGPGTKMGHFSYLGDATIGEDVNIGAGTITCNYDGKQKHPTQIGAGAFIGSDTMLVAPVNIGEGARTGAGAVVTKDVQAKTLAVGVPARAIRKLE